MRRFRLTLPRYLVGHSYRLPLPLLEPLFILQVQERESAKYSVIWFSSYLGKVYQTAISSIVPLSQAQKFAFSKGEGKAPVFQ